MAEFFLVNITDGKYSYGKLFLKNHTVEESEKTILEYTKVLPKESRRIRLDCVFTHYFVKELKISQFYRINVIRKWADGFHELAIVLQPTNYDLIDYEWNDRIFVMVREKCELEHALSWLSTLGGAFSALGDYFPSCADTAGKISFHQLKLALRLGDPSIASRCRLYLSLSLIQKKKFRLARRIISREYDLAHEAPILDVRLLNMCHGIWSKLQYEHRMFKKHRRILCDKIGKVKI